MRLYSLLAIALLLSVLAVPVHATTPATKYYQTLTVYKMTGCSESTAVLVANATVKSWTTGSGVITVTTNAQGIATVVANSTSTYTVNISGVANYSDYQYTWNPVTGAASVSVYLGPIVPYACPLAPGLGGPSSLLGSLEAVLVGYLVLFLLIILGMVVIVSLARKSRKRRR